MKFLSTVTILLSSLITACTSNSSASFIPKGWVEVNFNASSVYDRATNTNLDEFIGPLVQKGILPTKSIWLKPTYGNQNILWFGTPTLGGKQLQEDMKKNSEGAAPPWNTSAEQQKVGSITWDKVTLAPKNSDFEISIWTCTSLSKSQTVALYWGTETKMFGEDLKQLLSHLEKGCS